MSPNLSSNSSTICGSATIAGITLSHIRPDTTAIIRHSPRWRKSAKLQIKSRILPLYEQSHFTSREFYQELKDSRKLTILDGPEVLPLVQAAYRKLHVIPSDLRIQFVKPYIDDGNVYIGVMAASELKQKYRDF